LSGRGLCDELVTRPEESYRLCCVVVCDLETSRMGAPYIYDISCLRVNSLQFYFSFSYTGPKILLYTFLSKMFNCSLSLFVSVPVSDAYVNVLSIVVFFIVNFSFFDMFLFLKIFVA